MSVIDTEWKDILFADICETAKKENAATDLAESRRLCEERYRKIDQYADVCRIIFSYNKEVKSCR